MGHANFGSASQLLFITDLMLRPGSMSWRVFDYFMQCSDVVRFTVINSCS